MENILEYCNFLLVESSPKKLKKSLKGSLDSDDRAKMRKALRNNIVTFKFTKRNGEVRTAHGTLYPDFLPALRGGSPKPEHQMVYFDIDKDGWRSFRSYTFIKILNLKPVTEKEIDDFLLDREIEKDRKKAMSKREKEEVVKKVHSEESAKKHRTLVKIKGDDEDAMDSVKHHEEKIHKKKEKHDEPVKKKKEKDVVERIHDDADIDDLVDNKKDGD